MLNSDWLYNPDRILTGFGVLLAAISVLYFGREAILNLSPLVKSFVLVSLSAIFAISSFYVDDNGSKILSYVLSTVSYLTFLIYYIGRMSPSSETIFLLLGISGALFIFAGRNISGKNYEKQKIKKAIAAISIIIFGVIAVDTVSSEPAIDIEFSESVQIGEMPVKIGDVKVRNDYLLPQVYSIDNIEVCRSQREYRLRPEDYEADDGVVPGLSSKNVEYEISRNPREDEVSAQNLSVEVVDQCGEIENGTVQVSKHERLD